MSIIFRNSKVKSMKKLHKGSKSIPMARMHGDNIQFGFKSDAMLRVLVSVGDKRASIENVQEAMHMKQPAPCQNMCQHLLLAKNHLEMITNTSLL